MQTACPDVPGSAADKEQQIKLVLKHRYVQSHPSGATLTHVFVGSVGPHQRPIQTRLHVVDLLIILRKGCVVTPVPPVTTHARKMGMGKSHCNDVEEVVISQCVQYGGDGLSGDGQPETFHAAADIH